MGVQILIIMQILQINKKDGNVSVNSNPQIICTCCFVAYILMNLILFIFKRLSEFSFALMVTFGIGLIFFVWFIPNLEKFKITFGGDRL